jgi:hypothetical protein
MRLVTDRLELMSLTAEALSSLILADRRRLEALTGARFPDPLVAPPLMEDALPSLRDQLVAQPGESGWGPWLAIARATREAVGGLTISRPDADSCSAGSRSLNAVRKGFRQWCSTSHALRLAGAAGSSGATGTSNGNWRAPAAYRSSGNGAV